MEQKTQQMLFNEIRGEVLEIMDGEEWCSIVITVGHDNKRLVNLVCKKLAFDDMFKKRIIKLKDFVVCRFYISSRKAKNERYYTNANLLSINLVERFK